MTMAPSLQPQYSCLENPTNRGAWLDTVHKVIKSWNRLKQLNTHNFFLSFCYIFQVALHGKKKSLFIFLTENIVKYFIVSFHKEKNTVDILMYIQFLSETTMLRMCVLSCSVMHHSLSPHGL